MDEESLQNYLKDFEDLTELKDRGVLKKIIKEGHSNIKPCPEDTVIVHYVGTYFGGDQHGVQFDSSRDRNERFRFTIGKGDVIKAWDIAVATMKIGEICELIAAPDYGYFDGKTMKFEVELFDTEGSDVTKDNSGKVRKSILEKGRDIFTPTVGLNAEVNFRRGFTDDETFREVSYVVGDPEENDVPVCVDLAVQRMNTAERSLVRSKSNTSDGEIIYEVFLKSFEKFKPLSTATSFDKQMELADQLKTKANDFLKASKFSVALGLYKKLDSELSYVIASGVEQHKKLYEVTTALHLNLALAYLKLNDAPSCTEMCKKVLETNISNEKALFRLGQACLLRKDHEDASVYFKRIVSLNPDNAAAARQLLICEEMLQKAKEKEKKMYRGIFERFKETGLGTASETS